MKNQTAKLAAHVTPDGRHFFWKVVTADGLLVMSGREQSEIAAHRQAARFALIGADQPGDLRESA